MKVNYFKYRHIMEMEKPSVDVRFELQILLFKTGGIVIF